MYPDCARRASLFEGLRQVDADLAARTRKAGCPHCGGALDDGGWLRKPRGCEVDLPEKVRRRHGLCCRACRRRVLPPSAVFLDRKVYLGAVVLMSIAARQRRLVGSTANALRKLFGVSKDTLGRWLAFFRVDLPASDRWRRVRGVVSADVRNDTLPSPLLAQLDRRLGEGEAALQACLRLLATGELQAS